MIAVDFGVTISEAGLLVTLFALAAAIFAPILIALTINMDRKKLLMATVSVFIISNGLMFISSSFEYALGIRIIQGVSGGITTVVAMAVATRLVEKERRGRAIGIILMGLSSSLVLGVPIGTFFSEIFGWRVLFMLIGLLTILPLLIIYKKNSSYQGGRSCYTQIAAFDFKRFKNSNCPGYYFILCRWLRYPIYLYYAFLTSHIHSFYDRN